MRKGPDTCRQESRADQEEPQVEPDEDRGRADEKQHVSDPGQGGLGGDPLDLTDVIVDARHDVAKSRACVKAGREPLQVTVERQPHVEEDLGRDSRIQKTAGDVEDEPRERDARKEQHEPPERRGVAAQQGHVDQIAREEWHEERKRGTQQAQAKDETQPAPVGGDICEGAPKGEVEQWRPVSARRAPASRSDPWSCRRRA